jgi:hypothetical protein
MSIFKEDGTIQGMRRILRKIDSEEQDIFAIYATINGKAYNRIVMLDKKGFDEAYKLAIKKIVALHSLELTPALQAKFQACKDHYRVNKDAIKRDERRAIDKLLFSTKFFKD